MAETFTDLEAYDGTCYKAAGWVLWAIAKGFSRHAADFYVPSDRSLKRWAESRRS